MNSYPWISTYSRLFLEVDKEESEERERVGVERGVLTRLDFRPKVVTRTVATRVPYILCSGTLLRPPCSVNTPLIRPLPRVRPHTWSVRTPAALPDRSWRFLLSLVIALIGAHGTLGMVDR